MLNCWKPMTPGHIFRNLYLSFETTLCYNYNEMIMKIKILKLKSKHNNLLYLNKSIYIKTIIF